MAGAIRFLWRSTCSTCRKAREFLRGDLKAALDEMDYAKNPLTVPELSEIFKAHDAREFINPRSPQYKALGLAQKPPASHEQALQLIVKEPRLLKRPITIVGKEIIAGFDKDRLREAVGRQHRK